MLRGTPDPSHASEGSGLGKDDRFRFRLLAANRARVMDVLANVTDGVVSEPRAAVVAGGCARRRYGITPASACSCLCGVLRASGSGV